MASYRVVVVGDMGTGKTSLVQTLSSGRFPSAASGGITSGYGRSMLPTADDTSVSVSLDGREVALTLVDTAAGMGGGRVDRDYQQIPQYFANADAFLVMYAIENPWSLSSVQRKWVPMIRQHLKSRKGKRQQRPIVLLGNKADLRDEQQKKHDSDSEKKAASDAEWERTHPADAAKAKKGDFFIPGKPYVRVAEAPVTAERADDMANTLELDGAYECSTSEGRGLLDAVLALVREVEAAKNDVLPAGKDAATASAAESEDEAEADDDYSLHSRKGATKTRLSTSSSKNSGGSSGLLASIGSYIF